MNPVLTDWLTVATAGPCVDGRRIEEQTLRDCAETYDREEYVAFLNVEHFYGNLGSVWALRLNTDKKGRTVLQARIRPNKYYLDQNGEDHRLCFSVEIMNNFCGSGRAYLTGLATTDYPASVGTTEARFSRQDLLRGQPQQSDAIRLSEESASISESLRTVLNDFFNVTRRKEKEMTKEEFSDALKPVTEKLTALAEKFEKMIEPKLAGNPDGKPEAEAVDLKAEFAKLAAGIADLSTRLDEAMKEVPARGSDAGTGEVETANLI